MTLSDEARCVCVCGWCMLMHGQLSSETLMLPQFQRAQVRKFCASSDKELYTFKETPQQRSQLHRHLLFDDHKRTIFCFVEKAGELIFSSFVADCRNSRKSRTKKSAAWVCRCMQTMCVPTGSCCFRGDQTKSEKRLPIMKKYTKAKRTPIPPNDRK